ncbi:MAG: recombination mediator RecR [Candidatus Melainabacteria bacterium]
MPQDFLPLGAGPTSQPLNRLIDAFRKLPGVGPKSAQRLAFHVLKQPPELAQDLAQALVDARTRVGFCGVCFNLSGQSPCEICASRSRHRHQVCVVAESRDLFALERTHEYRGLYHVLLGLISPLDGIGPEDLKVQALISRLQASQAVPVTPDGQPAPESTDADTTPPVPIEEVILALPPSIEGDTTSLYLAKLLKPLQAAMPLRVTRIAFGLPVGGELEYADSMTLVRALQGRQDVG